MKKLATLSLVALLVMQMNAQDYEPGMIRVLVADTQFIPVVAIDEGDTMLVSSDSILTELMSAFTVFEAQQTFPDAYRIDHPLAEKLARYYDLLCDCDESELFEAVGESQSSAIAGVELIPICIPTYNPNDYGSNGGFIWNQVNLDIIRAKEAWDITTGDPDVEIAIVELSGGNGFEVNHEDLSGQITYIDASVNQNPGAGEFHGTAVAGCAAADTDNGLGIAAIGFNCKLRLYQGSTNMIIKALADGARIISCSWGSCGFSASQEATIDLAYSMGTIVLAGAGNGNQGASCAGGPQVGFPVSGQYRNGYFYPAAHDHALSVTSVNPEKYYEQGTIAHTHNDHVDVAACGFRVPTTTTDEDGSYTGEVWGTSFATPTVAGLVGLMFSANACLQFDDVLWILRSTLQDISTIHNNDAYYQVHGAGLIDARAALELVVDGISAIIKEGQSLEWTSSMFLTGDVIIKAGATLTITSTIEFADNARIVIEQGGRLVLDGATLSGRTVPSVCTNTGMWGGIRVLGHPAVQHPSVTSVTNGSYPVDEDDHGVVIIKNGSVIRDAIVGVRNTDHAWPHDNFGGIIYAENSEFINCWKGMEFYKFRPSQLTPGAKDANVSRALNCTFTTDGLFNNEELGPNAHITMWAVRGVIINHCTFQNLTPQLYSINRRGIGIGTYDAGFSMNGAPTTHWPNFPSGPGDWDYGLFKNLHYGIRAEGFSDPFYQVRVFHQEFDNCWNGIDVYSSDFDVVRENKFTVPAMLTSGPLESGTTRPYGIRVRESFGTVVSGNEITSLSPGTGKIGFGIVVRDAYMYDVTVAHNTITETQVGIQAEQFNPYLSLDCNHLYNNLIGLSVNPELFGQLKWQGEGCAANHHRPANDFIDFDCQNGDLHIRAGIPITYFENELNPYLVDDINCVDAPGSAIMMCPDHETEGADQCNYATVDGGGWTTTSGYANSLRTQISGETDPFVLQALRTELMRVYLAIDTTDEVMLDLLDEIGGKRADMAKVTYRYALNDYDSARTLLEEYELEDVNDTLFYNIFDMLIYQGEQSTNLLEFDSARIATLAELGEGEGRAAAHARNAVEFLVDSIRWLVHLEEWGEEKKGREASADTRASIRNHPNPFSHSTTVYYSTRSGEGELVIVNLFGMEKIRVELAQVSGQIEVSGKDLGSGIHFLLLYERGKLAATDKMILIK